MPKLTSLVLFFIFTIGYSQSTFSKNILFDQAHDQRFLINGEQPLDLSIFAQLFVSEHDLVSANQAPIDSQVLSATDILVISGAFSKYSSLEKEEIVNFVERGGKLCIMLHVGPINGSLLNKLNVAVTNGVIKEQQNMIDNNPLNFSASRLQAHPILEGVSSFNFYGAWAIKGLGPDVEEVAFTSNRGWIDLNRNNLLDEQEVTGEWAVALVGKLGLGQFVVFGDDAIFQNRFIVEDNLTVAKNLIAWLKS